MSYSPIENPSITTMRRRITTLKHEFIEFNKTLPDIHDYDKEMLLLSSDLISKRDDLCHDLRELYVLGEYDTPENHLLLALSKHCYLSLKQKYEVSGLPFPFTTPSIQSYVPSTRTY